VPVIPPPPREFDTYEPTGDASWPLTGLAGVDHAGKTYLAAQASGSDLIGQTFFIPFGEAEANAYGRVPGARFKIVHLPDGSYRTLLGAVLWAVRQPRVTPDKPNLIILDGGTKLYHMLQEEQQLTAYQRAVAKAKERGWRAPDPDALRISNDGWNAIKERWAAVIDPLKEHDGPAIVTVLLEDLMVVNDKGEPTKDRTWKWQAHKTLQSRCDDTLEIRDRDTRDVLITGTRSLIWRPADGEVDGRRIPGFTFDRYWRTLGLDKAPVSQPAVAQPDATAYLAEVAEQTARDVAANEQASDRRDAIGRGELPTAATLMQEIEEALHADNPRRALLQIRSGYGASVLEQVQGIRLKNGTVVNGDEAVRTAIEFVATGQAPAPEPAPQPEQPTDEVVPVETIPDRSGPAPTGRWTLDAALRAEITLQAKVLGVEPDKHVAPALGQVGLSSFQEITLVTARRSGCSWSTSGGGSRTRSWQPATRSAPRSTAGCPRRPSFRRSCGRSCGTATSRTARRPGSLPPSTPDGPHGRGSAPLGGR
jgi:hypothetical protein